MNVLLPQNYKIKKKDIIVYSIAIIVCIISLIIIVMRQILGEGIFKKAQKTTEEELSKLKTEFGNMFQNEFIGDIQGISKDNQSKNFVFTTYANEENVPGNYALNVNIPQINIMDENLEKINDEIIKNYKKKVNEIINTEGKQIVYSVEYTAYAENDILFLIIRSNEKEGNNAQRSIIKTYHYDLKNKKEITLEEIIEKLQYDENEVQNKIYQEIKSQEQKSKQMQQVGLGIYVRDSKSDKYKIENSKEFFVHNGKLNIIYSYGEETLTSEMDIVII